MEILRPIQVPFASGQVRNRQILSLKRSFTRLSLSLHLLFSFLSRTKLVEAVYDLFFLICHCVIQSGLGTRQRVAQPVSSPDISSAFVLFSLKGLTPTGQRPKERGGLGTSVSEGIWNLPMSDP